MWLFDTKNQVIFRPLTGEYYRGNHNAPLWTSDKKKAMRFEYIDAARVMVTLGVSGVVICA